MNWILFLASNLLINMFSFDFSSLVLNWFLLANQSCRGEMQWRQDTDRNTLGMPQNYYGNLFILFYVFSVYISLYTWIYIYISTWHDLGHKSTLFRGDSTTLHTIQITFDVVDDGVSSEGSPWCSIWEGSAQPKWDTGSATGLMKMRRIHTSMITLTSWHVWWEKIWGIGSGWGQFCTIANGSHTVSSLSKRTTGEEEKAGRVRKLCVYVGGVGVV